ncbi:MAG TPA: hypothetical protein VF043_04975 [Ktedonobacteraceae bacterium]
MHVPLVEQQEQLVLGEGAIDQSHRHAVEGQVPRGVPGVLPGVGHEDEVVVREVPPAPVAAALGWWRRAGGVATQPFIHIVGVELLAPEQAGQRLPLHRPRIVRLGRTHLPVKLVGFPDARAEDLGCAVERGTRPGGGQAHEDGLCGARLNDGAIVGRHPGAGALWVDFALGTVDHCLVDAVFDERRAALDAPQSLGVGFVLGKEQLGRSLAGQPVVTKLVMAGMDKTITRHFTRRSCFILGGQHGPAVVIAPGPRVAKPERGKQAQRGRLQSAVGSAHADQYVERVDFGIFYTDIEVAVFRKDACVDQLVFGFLTAPVAIRGDKIVIGKRALRVFVEGLHVRVGRGVVEKEVVFLHIFSVVAL